MKLIAKRKNMKFLIVALALAGAPLLTPISLQAQVHPGETEQEHKVLVGIVSEFAAYGDALEAFTKNFFGVIPNKFTKNQFINLAQKLHGMITGIKERSVKYKEAVSGPDSKVILTELEKLAQLLETSSKSLLETLQKFLGTKSLLVSLRRLGTEESKQAQKIRALQKAVGSLLAKHSERAVQEQFAQFVNHVEYALTFPDNNMRQVLSIAIKYSSLK